MRRVAETNIFLRNNNCTTALSTARRHLEATDEVFMKKTVLFCQHKCKIIQGNKTLKWKNKLLQDYKLNNYPQSGHRVNEAWCLVRDPIFLSSGRPSLKTFTEMKREDIIQSSMTQKIVIFQEMSSMNVDYFHYSVLDGNFMNFRLCEIQLGAQCLLGENGLLNCLLVVIFQSEISTI